MNSHPEQSDLLRFIDGELPAREARAVERHVEACWDCRAEIEELKKTVADCVRYRKEVLAEAMPEAPQAWGDIYAAFARIDRDQPQRVSLLQILRGMGSPRWAVGALTAALAVAGALYFGGTPSVTKRPATPSPIQEPQLFRNDAGSGAAPVEVPPRPAVPSRPAAPIASTSQPAASISDELRVLRALHGIGADLGDPLRVSLSQGKVLVAGTGLAPQRQREIEAALDRLPGVSTEFAQPPAAPLLPAGAQAVAPSPAEAANPFQAKLLAQFGGQGALDRFTGQVLNWNETLMAHAYALRSLAQQFPSDAGMGDADRASLHRLVIDHLKAMNGPADNFDRAMVPLLTALGASAPAPTAESAASWQAVAERVFQSARNVEMLSSKLLGIARGEKANVDLPAELLGAVSDLRAGLEHDQHLVGR